MNGEKRVFVSNLDDLSHCILKRLGDHDKKIIEMASGISGLLKILRDLLHFLSAGDKIPNDEFLEQLSSKLDDLNLIESEGSKEKDEK